jgi:hypothetical protein
MPGVVAGMTALLALPLPCGLLVFAGLLSR